MPAFSLSDLKGTEGYLTHTSRVAVRVCSVRPYYTLNHPWSCEAIEWARVTPPFVARSSIWEHFSSRYILEKIDISNSKANEEEVSASVVVVVQVRYISSVATLLYCTDSAKSARTTTTFFRRKRSRLLFSATNLKLRVSFVSQVGTKNTFHYFNSPFFFVKANYFISNVI